MGGGLRTVGHPRGCSIWSPYRSGIRRISFPQDILSVWSQSLVWGPEGKQIIFGGIRNADRREMIGTIDLSNGAITQLAMMSASNLSRSPDGSKIAFTSNRSGNADIWVVSSSGGRPRQITIDRAEDWGPAWSPDGTEITFASDREGSFDLWAIPSTGGNPRRITSGEKGTYGASWSPDGRWIAFVASGEIRKVPAEGGISSRLASVSLKEGDFLLSTAWSQDSRLVRYITGERDDRTSLWEVPASGGRPSRLVRFPKELGLPDAYALSPDEKMFAAVRPTWIDIWMVKVPQAVR
jgi:Tol biopolymer transport system component